jgi:hypothetical protein
MMIVKNRSNTANWVIYHKGLNGGTTPEQYALYLDLTDAEAASSSRWNDTAPTSSVFSVGGDNSGTNDIGGDDYIAYLFASIEGFSKVFSYTGNASPDGPFVYCGFRPKFVLFKNSASVYNWYIFDTERDTFNVVGEQLFPNDSSAGADTTSLDILSNGFKMKTNGDNRNESGAVFIGIAFAETPFKYANAR